MSVHRTCCSLKSQTWRIANRRSFSISGRRSGNLMLNLTGMAFAKEAQYFSKERKMPREEFHPMLQLIRSSEVDPFAPAAGASPTVIAALRRAERGESDLKTAYTLMLSNLVVQLEVSRKEKEYATNALLQLQDKHRSQERHILFWVLGIVTFLSVNHFKPDTWDMMRNDVASFIQDLRRFDWQWLGHPPAYRSTNTAATSSSQPTPLAQSDTPLPQETESTSDLAQSHKHLVSVNEPFFALSTQPRGWSRLFWASPHIE